MKRRNTHGCEVNEFGRPLFRSLLCGWLFLGAFASCTAGVPTISSVTRNADQVGAYAKLELAVGLTAAFTNPYDTTQVDLGAEFTSPTNKVWKINGFYDGSGWKVRFAPNETGSWSYVVKVTDAGGTGQSASGSFTCVVSGNHGWVRPSPNKRYLCCDDGSSFFGVGPCYPWAVTTNGLDQLQTLGCNVWVYWNGTYDQGGGGNLIESMASGIGKYDQGKCTRIDSLVSWSEERGLSMILVVWPHDYLAATIPGNAWAKAWSSNAYSTIVSCADFYGDTSAWTYQTKQYRYIIARWGYSQAISGWQTIDEIAGTDGWSTPVAATAWVEKIADYFNSNDPFKHLTTGSQGGYWPIGDSVHSVSNTELYGTLSAANVVTTVKQLWNSFVKPCIMGETGGTTNVTDFHNVIWSSLATGISVTPLWWSFNQSWSSALSSQYAPFLAFIKDVNFAGLTSLSQAAVSVPGCSGWAITSDQITFGWITGSVSGKTLAVEGVRNGNYQLEWFDCSNGSTLSTSSVSTNNDTVRSVVPTTSQNDLAFKVISTDRAISAVRSGAQDYVRYVLHYREGVVSVQVTPEENIVLEVMTAGGRVVARGTAIRGRRNALAVGTLDPGAYVVRIVSAGHSTLRQLVVE